MVHELRRVVAVHDVSGYGKCALTVAMPVISAAGVEVLPVPTAVLSTNTLFEGFTFFDYTPYIEAHLAHWKKLGLSFNCVYSGFLGSVQQIAYVKELMFDFESGISVIDPVMGDNGVMIKIYTQEMVEAMKGLVAVADYATPNVMEAGLLCDRPFVSNELTSAQAKDLCQRVLELGVKNLVLTGTERNGRIYNCGISQQDGYFELPIDMLPYRQHGTGDLFTSTMVAGLVRGNDLQASVDSAARFVYDCMEYGSQVADILDRGPAFEPLVGRLASGLYVK